MAISPVDSYANIQEALAPIGKELDLQVWVQSSTNPRMFSNEITFAITSTVNEDDTLVPVFIRLKAFYKILVDGLPSVFGNNRISVMRRGAGLSSLNLTVENLVLTTEVRQFKNEEMAIVKLEVY